MSHKIIIETEVTEKCLLPETDEKETALHKNELGKQNSSSSKDEIAENCSTDLKKDLSNEKDGLEILLSEGEASSGFETVSSVDSNIDPDDFDLSSTAEDDFNVVVEIENELAFQTHKGSSERTFYWRDTRNTPDEYDTRPKDFLGEYPKKRHDDFGAISKKHRYWLRGSKVKNYEYDEYRDNEDRRDKKFSEREAFICRRQHSVNDSKWDRRNNQFRKYFRSRISDHDLRSRVSRSNEFDSRPRRSRSSDCDSRTRCSRSSERDSRTRYSRSSDYDNRGRGSEGSSEHDYRYKRSRSVDSDGRHRCSRSVDSDCRHKNGRGGDCDCDHKHIRRSERIRRSQPFRNAGRSVRYNGSGYKDRNTGGRRSRSFGRSPPKGLDRDSPTRKKRRRSYSKSPTSSVWKRLESGTSSRGSSQKRSRKSLRKKERTPFLVELERKLKEADRLKESKKGNSNSVQPEVSQSDKTVPEILVNATQSPVPPSNILVPEMQSGIRHSPPKPRMPKMSPRLAQNVVAPFQPTFAPPLPSIPRLGIPLQFTFPEMSVDNLPLVVGPTGLPVHITLTGEHIPHDLDGRRIPVGPNGYYLPLDPTGRLFPHIVSPGNQAVPIHMTEDGVLRLPNSEPVPYGPAHKFPVDVDGIIIPIGPDSRPLFPCPNLPRQPPVNILKMIGTEPMLAQVPEVTPEAPGTGNEEIVPIEPQQAGSIEPEHPPPPEVTQSTSEVLEIGIQEIPLPEEIPKAKGTQPQPPPELDLVILQLPEQGNQKTAPPEGVQQTGGNHQDDTERPRIDSALVDIIQSPSEKINKADLLKNYKRKAQERTEDILKCKEIEKNLGVNPSKGGVKRSTPMKFSQKKISRKSPDKEDSNTTVTDMVLESDDSDSASDVRSAKRLKNDSFEENLLCSNEVQNILKSICDTETSKTPQTGAGAKPKDAIAKKVQQAIKSLSEGNYKPPVIGRLIVSCLVEPVVRKSPNESPLLRNRMVLPFITPSAAGPQTKDHPPAEEKTDSMFKFLPQEVAKKGKKPSGFSNKSGRAQEGNPNAMKIPVFTFDFAMQCDFTSVMIKSLNSKIAELEMEVIKLKNMNANLIDSYKNVQAMNEKKNAELRKALLDIQERNNEIQALKGSLGKK